MDAPGWPASCCRVRLGVTPPRPGGPHNPGCRKSTQGTPPYPHSAATRTEREACSRDRDAAEHSSGRVRGCHARSATNEPIPGVVTIKPSSRSAAVALRTVPRATPNSLSSCTSLISVRGGYSRWRRGRAARLRSAPTWAASGRSRSPDRLRPYQPLLRLPHLPQDNGCRLPRSEPTAQRMVRSPPRRPWGCPVICARCDKPIRECEEYETRDVMRPSGPCVTLLVHKGWCKRAPQPTAPSGLGR